MLRSLLTIGLCCSMSASATQIHGTIRVTKTLTKKRVSLPQVYERAAAVEAAATTQDDKSWRDAELKRVVVYIEGSGPASKPITAVIDQHRRKFEPEVIAIPAGSSVSFPNSDPVFHNVFSLSKTKAFDLGNYRMGESRLVKFPEPGIVSIHCHLHPNMAAAIIVTPNGWFAQPDDKGSFEIPDLAPGDHTLVAWHKSAGAFRRKLHVDASGTMSIDIEIPIRVTEE